MSDEHDYPTPHKCCGKVMSYRWDDLDQDKYEIIDGSHYPTLDDEWECESCGKTLPSRRYRDWFGSGDLDMEVQEVIEHNGQPLKILYDGYMACLIYPDNVLIFGYDGNEYCHTFQFCEEEESIETLGIVLNTTISLSEEAPKQLWEDE